MKRWIEITDEYVSKLKHMSRRKIRYPEGKKVKEQWALWDANEKCFFWDQGECAVYIDEFDRPTHVLVG